MGASKRYRKKPVLIDAVRWTGHNLAEVAALMQIDVDEIDVERGSASKSPNDGFLFVVREDQPPSLQMRTVHGQPAIARAGDWVIPEPVPGLAYPCKADIFAATYDVADADAPVPAGPRTAREHIAEAQRHAADIAYDRQLQADEQITGPTEIAMAQMHALVAIALVLEEVHRPVRNS